MSVYNIKTFGRTMYLPRLAAISGVWALSSHGRGFYRGLRDAAAVRRKWIVGHANGYGVL